MKWIVFLIGIIMILSCNNDIIYTKKIEIEHSAWYDYDALNFEFDMQDTNSMYELGLEVEHAVNYGFENVYLKIKTVYPNDKIIEEPLSLELAGKGGNWYGDCSSTNCKLKIILQDKTLFRPAGVYRLEFSPYNREQPIAGIKSLKLIIRALN